MIAKWSVRLKWESFTEVYVSDKETAHEAISDAITQQGNKLRSRHVPGEIELQVAAYRISTEDD